MGRVVGNGARLRRIAAAVALVVLSPVAASAQQPTRSLQPNAQQFAPSGGPGVIAAGQVGLVVSARYGRDFALPINSNLVWRIYPVRPDQSGAFRPLKEEKTATPTFALPAGDYVVHVTFGLASAAKTVHLKSETV